MSLGHEPPGKAGLVLEKGEAETLLGRGEARPSPIGEAVGLSIRPTGHKNPPETIVVDGIAEGVDGL